VRRQAVGDGVPFLLHDATLERTTDGSGIAG
jgi:glycerophosphoryl diester phosphodiesterase